MVLLEDILTYVKSFDPDTVFFEAGYTESCPVAKYARDVLKVKNASFNGQSVVQRSLLAPSKFVCYVEPELERYVFSAENEYGINGDGRTMTAAEFLTQ